MTDRFNPGRLGDWVVYCDICGQKYYASETTKLSTYTGRGGCIVCKHDNDAIDYGLMPYKPRVERNVPFARIGDTNTDNAAPLVDLETMSYQFYLAASQDNAVIMASQDDAWLIVEEPI